MVVNEEANLQPVFLQFEDQIPGLRGHPRRVWPIGHCYPNHPSARQLHIEKYIEPLQDYRVHAEEVADQDCRRLRLQELLPAQPGPERGRPDPIRSQELPDRGGRYSKSQLDQLALDADAAPPGVIPGHLQDQLLELRIQTWSTWASAIPEGGPFPTHQLPMPAQHRLRLNQQPSPRSTVDQPAQSRHDHSIRRIQLRPLDLTAHDAKLVPE